MNRKKTKNQGIGSGSLRKRAEAILQVKPAKMPTLSTAEVQALIHELNIHQVELEIQNQELREAQLELAQSRDRYSDLYDFAPTGLVTLDRNGTVLEANLTAAAMLGVDRNNLLDQKLSAFVSRDSQDLFHLHRQAVFSDTGRQVSELDMRRQDGGMLAVRLESVPQAGGKPTLCRTALIDLTDLREAQRKILKLNETLEERVAEQSRAIKVQAKAIASLGEGVLITRDGADWPNPEIRFVNEAMCRITGYEKHELLGKSPSLLHNYAANREALDWFTAELSAGRSCFAELVNQRKDGTTYDAEVFITPFFDDQGQRTHYVSVHRDISNRKRAERALRESERRLRLALEAGQMGVWELDTNDNTLKWDKAQWNLFGLEGKGKLTRDQFFQRVCSSDQEHLRQVMDACVRQGKDFKVEFRIERPDGQRRWLVGKGMLIREDRKRAAKVIGINYDITNQKRNEFSLRQSEMHFRALFDQAITGILQADVEGRIVMVNDHFCQMLGYTKEAMLERTVKDLTHPTDWPEFESRLKKLLSHGTYFHMEKRIIREDGSEIWVNTCVNAITDSKNQIQSVEAIAIDITEAKLTTNALKVSEERLRMTLNTIREGIITTDLKGKISEVNPSAEQILGYAPRELIGHNLLAIVQRPDGSVVNLKEMIDKSHELQKSGNYPPLLEKIGVRKDGARIPVELSCAFIQKTGLIISVIRDITERRRLEQQLLTVSEEEKRELAHDLHDGLSQELGGLGYIAGRLAEILETENHSQTAQAKRIADQLVHAMESTRRLSHSLNPLMEGPADFQTALRLLTETTNEIFKIDCRFQNEAKMLLTDAHTAINLYRVAQEAIHNAFRHGKASQVVLTLQEKDGRIILRVSDNGIGLPSSQQTRQGIGIQIMKYRIATLGGWMRIENRNKNGVQVLCSVPNQTSDEKSNKGQSVGDP